MFNGSAIEYKNILPSMQLAAANTAHNYTHTVKYDTNNIAETVAKDRATVPVGNG